MAQRKSPAGRPPSKSASKSTRPPASATKKPIAGRPTAARTPTRPPPRKPGKSIVNQKQTPWGLIWTTVAIVLFAAGVVFAVIQAGGDDPATKAEAGSKVDQCTKLIGSNQTPFLNELQCAKDIKGVTFHPEPNQSHVKGLVKYDTTPPVGGNHNGYWADCDGTVYPNAIANENAVHMLEHGAVWITYNKDTIKADDLAKLKDIVDGQPRMALSPFPDLDSPISLQSWGYQLKVDGASDSRVGEFINALRFNPKTTPEYGAICSQPSFKLNPSTFGHPSS